MTRIAYNFHVNITRLCRAYLIFRYETMEQTDGQTDRHCAMLSVVCEREWETSVVSSDLSTSFTRLMYVIQETGELLDDVLTVVTSQQRDTIMTLLDCGLIELVKQIWSSCLCHTLQSQQDHYVPHHLSTSLWVTRLVYTCLSVLILTDLLWTPSVNQQQTA